MSGFGALASRVSLALVATAVTFAVFEMALRLMGPPQHVQQFRDLHQPRPDRPWLYGLRPGASGTPELPGEAIHYRINADGFRDREYARPKPDGTFRVLVLGDSVSFGYGVQLEETFPKVMERELSNAVPGAAVEVLNLGVGGYNPYNEFAQLVDVGASYEPDLVLVQFCINDLGDPTTHFDFHARQRLGVIPAAAYPVPTAERDESLPFLRAERLCQRSKVCSRLYNLFILLTIPEPSYEMRLAALESIEGTRGPEWDWLEARYREMAEASRRMGAEFAVLAFPFPAQLIAATPHPVVERLAEFGARHDWPTVDPLPAFQRAHREGRKVFIDTWHPTPLGHALAARASILQLACRDQLPPQARHLCPGDVRDRE